MVMIFHTETIGQTSWTAHTITHRHMHTHTHTRVHTHTHKRTHTHIRTYAHMHTHTRNVAHAQTHTGTRARTRAHTHKHSRTHSALTHIGVCFYACMFMCLSTCSCSKETETSTFQSKQQTLSDKQEVRNSAMRTSRQRGRESVCPHACEFIDSSINRSSCRRCGQSGCFMTFTFQLVYLRRALVVGRHRGWNCKDTWHWSCPVRRCGYRVAKTHRMPYVEGNFPQITNCRACFRTTTCKVKVFYRSLPPCMCDTRVSHTHVRETPGLHQSHTWAAKHSHQVSTLTKYHHFLYLGQ